MPSNLETIKIKEKQDKLLGFDKLIEEIKTENELAERNLDIVKRCKIGLRKLALVKKFSNIDAHILEVSKEQAYSNDFFSGILFLEGKRLTFKEEALKCHNQKTKIHL